MRRRNAGEGELYRPTYTTKDGAKKRSAVWWMRWTEDGKRIAKSTQTRKRGEAQLVLQHQLSKRNAGHRTVPALVTVNDLAELVLADYRANRLRENRASVSSFHVLRVLGKDTPAVDVDEAAVTAYTAHRLEEKAAPATVNRELAFLRRGFRLAVRSRRLERRPDFSLLREDNARKGFLERDQLDAIMARLDDDVRPVVLTAYLTGWRLASELLTRQRRHVDFANGWLILEPGEGKSKEGRRYPLIPELRAALEALVERTQALEQERGVIIPWLFHRNGKRILTFRDAWRKACVAAGLPGKLMHDCRRSAVRNMERAGVPRATGMALVGHKTESIYRRYAIVNEAMLKDGGEKLARLKPVRLEKKR
jgi:integrase